MNPYISQFLEFSTRWLMAGIHSRLDTIVTTIADAVAQLNAVATTLDKISGETKSLLVEIQTLKDAAAAAGEVPADLQAAIDAVSTRATGIDELVPDAPAA